uniref:F-box domain-containing protein n=1 Tax=Kalanchoe fedtschenkoi TaxID=63787 RepID=A0A7N0VFJ3_KALFE
MMKSALQRGHRCRTPLTDWGGAGVGSEGFGADVLGVADCGGVGRACRMSRSLAADEIHGLRCLFLVRPRSAQLISPTPSLKPAQTACKAASADSGHPRQSTTKTTTSDKTKSQERGCSAMERLPDDLLMMIVSHLTLPQAARTSVLSRRWQNFWKCVHGFTFDDASVADPFSIQKILQNRPPEFSITTLSIHCSYPYPYLPPEHWRGQVDQWFRSALENRVENFHLDLFNERFILKPKPNLYGHSGLNYLKSVTLIDVKVSRAFVEFLLASCPCLTRLCLDCVGHLDYLEISNPPALRFLEICNVQIKKLHAPHLTSFIFSGWKSALTSAIQTPKLVDLSISRVCCKLPFKDYTYPFRSYLPSIEKLELELNRQWQELELLEVPLLKKLKCLTISTFEWEDRTFRGLCRLMNACPVLQSLTLQVFPDFDDFDEEEEMNPIMRPRKKSKLVKSRLVGGYHFESLKEMKFVGAMSETPDLYVMRCIIKGSPNLERLIFDTDRGRRNVADPLKKKVRELRKILGARTKIILI